MSNIQTHLVNEAFLAVLIYKKCFGLKTSETYFKHFHQTQLIHLLTNLILINEKYFDRICQDR